MKNYNTNVDISTLKWNSWKLSKTSFVQAMQCPKQLYLSYHKKKERRPFKKSIQNVLTFGKKFEIYVRKKAFPGGINIKELVEKFNYFNSYTEYLMDNEENITLYEASILEDEVFVMCDVLVKRGQNINIYEIKAYKKINDVLLDDLSIQYNVCKKRFKDKLESFNVILRKNNLFGKKYKIINLTDLLEERIKGIDKKIETYKYILKHDKEPNEPMGEHCTKPFTCQFIAYCKSNA